MDTLGLRLIGLHGFRGCGKDTICDHLLTKYDNLVRLSFGDILRKELYEVFDIKFSDLFNRSKDYEYSDVTWSWFNTEIRERYGRPSKEYLTFRELMQVYATDYRRKEDPNYWLDQWKAQVNATPAETGIVCPDVRFANESKVFMEHGVLLRINDAIPREAPPHPSDALLPSYHFDIDGKGLQDVHTTCQQAVDACLVQQFVLNDKQKVLYNA